MSMSVYGPDSVASAEISYHPLGLTGWITTGSAGNGWGTDQESRIGEAGPKNPGVGIPEPARVLRHDPVVDGARIGHPTVEVQLTVEGRSGRARWRRG